MERAEYAAGSIDVRGSGPVHRVLNFLGAFFLGIGSEASRARESGNWWDRDETPSSGAAAVPITFGRQAELFDDAGHVAAAPLARAETPAAEVRPQPVVRPVAQTVVSVQAKSKSTARVVATTRVVPAIRVAAAATVAAAAPAARGAVAFQLIRSQSISSGKEESRWFSVPQRVLLPRYQLFEGADAVTEDGGGLRIGSPATRAQHGRVWFF